MKRALITGITGQDGAYLAKLLLSKGYKVFGGQRRSTSPKHWRLDEMGITKQIEFVELDVIDQANIRRAIEDTQLDEVYNLAAQSFVWLSFKQPELTTLIDAMGCLRILESIRQVNPKIKFYQASTSEMYGKVFETPQKETTKFWPRSPYGVAKLYAHHITINYREAYDMFACCGILFNHESAYRGEDFVTRKISKGLALWQREGTPIVLGNLTAKRDWGHAEDFVRGMWQMLQHDKPDDYVLATGVIYNVKQFADMALDYQKIDHYWKDNECFTTGINQLIITTDKKHLRPVEVDVLQGDATKAREVLGWEPNHNVESLIKEMVDADRKRYE
ncbi:MAG TPA: GDP-mannose 4,6-dehydratase [Flavobacteriaceae bacterium]|nr:GDP-mannose 4,6-dehydratase [Flavobacteriaceae bacterium]